MIEKKYVNPTLDIVMLDSSDNIFTASDTTDVYVYDEFPEEDSESSNNG